MKNIEINQLIENQVDSKVSELSSWKQVRWEGGRLYFETQRIINEIADYELESRIFYLDKLLNKNFVIQDNWPHSAPNITTEFKIWIEKTVSKLKIQLFQQNNQQKNNSLDRDKSYKKKARTSIAYKIKARLQKEVNSKCPFCSNEEVDHFHVHHIDENPLNNSSENLLMVCPNCHSKITKNDISQESVIKRKNELLLTLVIR